MAGVERFQRGAWQHMGEVEDVLTLRDLHFTYRQAGGSFPVLDGFSMSVREGEFFTLIGPSGSGKSTLFKLLTGLLEPDAGEILYRGRPFCRRLGKVGYMPQRDTLFPWRTVRENAALPLELKGWRRKVALERAGSFLGEFGLEAVADLYPHQLSGGLRQRVSFLRTVLADNDVLLLDEPFGALDALTRAQLQEWLLNLWQKLRKTVLFITHDVEEAILLSDRIGVLSARPLSTVRMVEVPLSRPRKMFMVTEEAFIRLKRQLLEQIRGKEGALAT